MHWTKIPIGYGVKILGATLKKYHSDFDIKFNGENLPTSFDDNIVPNYFALKQADFDFQDIIPNQFWGERQHFFEAFGLFSSDRDALSCLGGPAPKDVALYMYEAFIPDNYQHEPGKSYFHAVQDGTYRAPTLNFEKVGFEIFDLNFTSITHWYYDKEILHTIKWTPDYVNELQEKYSLPGLIIIKIHQAIHPWWFGATM